MSDMNPRAVVRQATDGKWLFHCPGCGCAHGFQTEPLGPPTWSFNGDVERPTVSPSILVQSVEMTEKGRADLDAWLAAGKPIRAKPGFESRPTVCHSFVTNGQIQFLGDCTHALAGQTVPLEPF